MKRFWILVAVLLTVLAVREAPTRSVLADAGPLPSSVMRAVDDALAQHRVTAAVRAAAAATRTAQKSARWEDLVAVGDAYARIGEVVGARETYDAKAQGLYRTALRRARQAESLEGVMRVAEAFAAVGDPAGATDALRIAEGLADDAEARADVRALAARLAAVVPVNGAR